MLSRIKKSIVLQMTLLVFGSTFLVFGIVGFFSYTGSRSIILNEGELQATTLTHSVVRRIEQEFKAVEKIVHTLGIYLDAYPADQEQSLRTLIRSNVVGNSEIFGAGIFFEPFGFRKDQERFALYYFKKENLIEYADLATPDYDYFYKEFYTIPRLMNQPFWTNPYFDIGGGNILMATYSVPIYRHADNDKSKDLFTGILTADISLEWLTELIESVHIGETGFGFIIDNTGVFVSFPDQEFIMRESVFSRADKLNMPGLRTIGRQMIHESHGFISMGSDLTGEDAYLAWHRIDSTDWIMGTVMHKSELFADLHWLWQRTLFLLILGICLLLFASILVVRSLAKPLISMAGATQQITDGNLDIDLSHIRRTDEVGRLAVSIEDMAEGLRQKNFIRDTFGRYLSKEVVENLLESKDGLKLGGESREISLMMSDLRGFTKLTAQMPPNEVISFLNRYLGRMVEILVSHKGVIDEIIGDGILAFFGAPEPLEDHAVRAVACALEMQSVMAEVNRENNSKDTAHLEMGISVHTGTVVVGNIGSEKRSKYGAVGADVNFTGRIESYTVGGQVLISEATYQKVAPHVQVKEVIRLRMKGFLEEVTVYDVNGIKGPYNIFLPETDETPVRLLKSISVSVRRLNEKILESEKIPAKITHASANTLILYIEEKLKPYENIQVLLNSTPGPKSEFYGKVIKVDKIADGSSALVRFTSQSPDALTNYLNENAG